jgi:hypothetical protein
VNVTNWITAIVAVAALLLSIYNVYIQRKDRLPSLWLYMDARNEPGDEPLGLEWAEERLKDRIYSCRVVNQGSVPTQVRAVRLFFENGREVPFPESSIEKEWLFEHEYCFLPNKLPYGSPRSVLPVTLQPFESVRFAAWKKDFHRTLQKAGFRGYAQFRVGVVDSLGKVHAVKEHVEVDPDPSLEDASPD